jgi:hypothetical protein
VNKLALDSFSSFQTPEKPKEPVIDQYKNPVMSLNELRPGLTYEVKHMNTYCRVQAKRNFFVRKEYI